MACDRPDPRIGVVVLTHNRVAEVVRTIEHLKALPERPYIVVVDNASVDGTSETLQERFPDVDRVRLRRNIGAAGRNAGVRRCRRPYVALCDDDTWWEPGGLARAAGLFDAHPQLAVITARVLVGADDRIDPTCAEMARSPLPRPRGIPGAPLLGFLAGASVVRRSAFLSAGGFEPRFFIGGEESLLALDLAAAGWALSYIDDIAVHHHPSSSRDVATRRRTLVRNALWTAWLRRPLRTAIARSIELLRGGFAEAEARSTLLDTVRGLPWALRHRRVVPAEIEHSLRLLEAMHE